MISRLDLEDLRESFKDFSSTLKDPRLERNKLHSLEEILFLSLCALLCGCEGWRDMERYGKLKIDFLREFFPYRYGIPSDDTLRRVFRSLDPEQFSICFSAWSKTLIEGSDRLISIDGKVSRRSFDSEGSPLHLVSAFASEYRLVLAQEKVSDKSNEIKAIPKLLELVDLKAAIVTIDAMGCQKEIADMICSRQADYVLALKGNQNNLHQDTKLLFENTPGLEAYEPAIHQTTDGSEHGRLEVRTYKAIEVPLELKPYHNWRGLRTLIEVTSERTYQGKHSLERRYYISSLNKDILQLSKAIRSHWSIENSLHWVLDISFRDDDSRIRRGNAPKNIAIIKHLALNLLQKIKEKRDSIKQLRKAAGWDNTLLLNALMQI